MSFILRKIFTAFSFLMLILIAENIYAKEVRNIFLDDKTIAKIPVSQKGTLLSFPVKPNKMILGSAGSFHIEYVENDLALAPARMGAQSNLFVYLLGRRFIFDLKATSLEGHTLAIIRDKSEDGPKKGGLK